MSVFNKFGVNGKRLKLNLYRFRKFLLRRESLFLIGLTLIFALVANYVVENFIDLLLDESVASLISRNQLFYSIYIPLLLLYINLVLIIRITIYRIKRQPGSFLRFKIIGFFFLSIMIPSLFFSFFFVMLFDQVAGLFNNEAVLNTLSTKLDNYQAIVSQRKEPLKQQLIDKVETGNFQIREDDTVSYLLVFEDGGDLVLFNKAKEVTADIPTVDLRPILFPQSQDDFFSYDEKGGYAYYLYRTKIIVSSSINDTDESIINYYAAVEFIDDNLKISILDTIDLMTQIRQLNLLIAPTFNLILLLFIYLYSQTFSIAVIIFYYRSKSYTQPIEELIKSTKKMSGGEWNKINLKPFINKMDENEIKQLLISFSNMIKDLMENKRKLDRLSNIEAWKEVATRLAHELKNPLTPIILASNEIENYLTLHDIKSYERLQKNFQFIYTEVSRIENLIKDFSKMSNNISLDKKPTKAFDLMSKIEGYISRYPEINFKTDVQCDRAVFMDLEKIFQVIINLVQNSVDSVNEKKQISINFQPIIHIKIFLTGQPSEQDLTIKISDNGIGIPEDRVDSIFKPYTTFKTDGTGLGLSICEEIINLHHGNIQLLPYPVTDSIEKITCFKITIPVD